MLFSPLEQFQILPLFSITFFFFDFSVTNETIFLILTTLFSFLLFIGLNNGGYKIIPTRWQSFLEIIYVTVLSLVLQNIKSKDRQSFFPLVFFIFIFILSLNLVGLIPYSFTLTSHLVITFYFSASIFVGINIICLKSHGAKLFSLFLPSGTSLFLAFVLVPIELISYIFKPISLSIRLFANMMAGHALLKIFVGFSFLLMTSSGFNFLLHYLPFFILVPLFGLELGIAVIQSFVFSMLICVYLNDAVNLG